MGAKLFIYRARVTSIYDADTITVDVDLGFHLKSEGIKLRLFGIDAPEMRGLEKQQGKVSRDWLRDQILDQEVVIRTYKDGRGKGKYGRWLADVYAVTDLARDDQGALELKTEALSFNQQLVKNGLAKTANY